VIQAQKVWEGSDSSLVWQIRTQDKERFYLKVEVRGKETHITMSEDKPDGLKPNGSLVSFLRKFCKSAHIPHILRGENGAHWIPLQSTSKAPPRLFIQVHPGSLAEIRIIDGDGVIRMRRNSQGTYTKRQNFEGPLPKGVDGMTDLLPGLIPQPDSIELSEDREVHLSKGDPETSQFPEYQRESRNRLARRLKTLKKSRDKMAASIASRTEIDALKSHATLLQTYLYKLQEGASELILAPEVTGQETETIIPVDPDQSPGKNLELYFKKIKKSERSLDVGKKKLLQVTKALEGLSQDLERIRTELLTHGDIDALLTRHGIGPAKPKTSKKKAAAPTTHRLLHAEDGTPLLVGKSATDNDALTKSAKANDHWVHVVGIPGSHVVIPSHKKDAPSPQTWREAGILAIHFSRLRQDMAGEVYTTQKRHLRKKKGLAVGMWLVEQANSLYIRYDRKELERILNRQASDDPRP
jgi:hypothetical protein